MFARPGIPGHIFLEGRLIDVTAALKGLVTVYNTSPRLIPPDQRVTLLSNRNPLSSGSSICEGQWVRCLHGLYHGDVGLVCSNDLTREVSMSVALVPRIPDRAVVSAKRKRANPRLWFASQVKAVWGEHRVRMTPNAFEYEFGGETYRTGLLIKHLPPASVVVVVAPDDMGPFAQSAYIHGLPFFDSMARRYAQYSIIVGQRVQVISGEQQGVVGHTTSIADGVVDVQPEDNDIPHLQVPQEQLLPVHRPGDHVKFQWSDTHGIVIPSEEPGSVSFIDTRTQDGVRTYVIDIIVANHIFQYTTHMYFVTPYTPPHTFYQFTPDTWVDFRAPKDTKRPKRRGWVHSVEDTRAIVIDEHTREEVREQTHTKTRLSFMIRSSG